MCTHQLAFLLVCETAHGRFEEEQTENGEEDEDFKENEPNERPSPGHVPEAVPVEVPDAQQEFFCGFHIGRG